MARPPGYPVAGVRPGHSFGSSRQVLNEAGTHKAVVTMGCDLGLSASVASEPQLRDLDPQRRWPRKPSFGGQRLTRTPTEAMRPVPSQAVPRPVCTSSQAVSGR